MKAILKRKTTKKKFEQDLIEKHGRKALSVSLFNEETDLDECMQPIYVKLSLYYAGGIHVGTWHTGGGVEFAPAK